ncbi:MAG: hypothetical protein MJY44_03030 [Bacteroidales bacterium]|nr:hypothetical protein [Bacteroidales bacterium]
MPRATRDGVVQVVCGPEGQDATGDPESAGRKQERQERQEGQEGPGTEANLSPLPSSPVCLSPLLFRQASSRAEREADAGI